MVRDGEPWLRPRLPTEIYHVKLWKGIGIRDYRKAEHLFVKDDSRNWSERPAQTSWFSVIEANDDYIAGQA